MIYQLLPSIRNSSLHKNPDYYYGGVEPVGPDSDFEMLRERDKNIQNLRDSLLKNTSHTRDLFDDLRLSMKKAGGFPIGPLDEEDKTEIRRANLIKIKLFVKRVSLDRAGSIEIVSSISDSKVTTITDHTSSHINWKENIGITKSAYEVSFVGDVKQNRLPEIANGNLGTVVFTEQMHMNNLYTGAYNSSHLAAIPAWIMRNITSVYLAEEAHHGVNLIRGYRQSLDVLDGVYTQTSVGDGFVIDQRVYAHRNFTPLLVHEVDIQRTPWTLSGEKLIEKVANGVLELSLPRRSSFERSYDITFTTLDHPTNSLYKEKIIHKLGNVAPFTESNKPGQEPNTQIHVFYTAVPDKISLPSNSKRRKYTFLLSADRDELVARHHLILGLQLISSNALYLSHLDAWRSVWEAGRITMTGGPLGLDLTLMTSQYYLLSNVPTRPHDQYRFGGFSPGGLAHSGIDTKNGFRGHVYWDQETWIMPALLLTHPGMARTMLQYRLDKANMAKKNAANNGFEGVQFPWDSGFSGIDLAWDPDNKLYQHHVTGDIAMALQWYILATNDTNFVYQCKGLSLLSSIGQFWKSRMVAVKKRGFGRYRNETRLRYEIHRAMGPDEYNFPVNNSAYVNAIAKLSLNAPRIIWNFTRPNLKVGDMKDILWSKMEKRSRMLYMPFDYVSKSHPEYDGYVNKKIKQADTVMLGFPIDEITDSEVFRNDLTRYEKVVDSGPCMTWSVHTIGWTELGDQGKAWNAFKMQLMHVAKPFRVWTEYASGGRSNFLTGTGGFLQSIIYGYLGLRLRPNGLTFHPVLPPQVTQLNITDLDYLGNQLKFTLTSNNQFSLLLLGHTAGAARLELLHRSEGRPASLVVPERALLLSLNNRYRLRATGLSWPSILVPPPIFQSLKRRFVDQDLAPIFNRAYLQAKRETEERVQDAKENRRSDEQVAKLLEKSKNKGKVHAAVVHLEKHIL